MASGLSDTRSVETHPFALHINLCAQPPTGVRRPSRSSGAGWFSAALRERTRTPFAAMSTLAVGVDDAWG